ncbi:MAG: hypothetical protein M3R68_10035, partial [Acidobacteriota bacterium]|nr:hypothetical protein [Acidobacteriota bacterium]
AESPGVKSTKLGSPAGASGLVLAFTSAIVIHTWLNGPVGDLQAAGSLILTETEATFGEVGFVLTVTGLVTGVVTGEVTGGLLALAPAPALKGDPPPHPKVKRHNIKTAHAGVGSEGRI